MKVCKRNLAGILIIALMLCLTVNNCIKFAIKEESSSQVNAEINDKNDEKSPKNADSFVPDPPGIYSGKYWNFTTGEIVGWRISTDYSTRDMIFNITDLKYFTATENVTGNNQPYYGVQLTPAYYNISTYQVEEFTNRTVFPLLNASLINYTLPKAWGLFSVENMQPFAFQNEDGGPEFFLNPFIPKNSSNNQLDIFWVAEALHWYYSIYLNGDFDPVYGYLQPPEYLEDLCDLTVTSNSIEYSNPAKGTYCNLYYYNNGTLQTGELKTLLMPQTTFTFNWTRIFDFDPLDDLKWSEVFDVPGDELFVGMDTNETKLVFNHTVDNMELEIEWDEEYEEWEIDLLYYQEIWANFSNWNYNDEDWEYINCSIVASANEIYPIVFGGEGDDNNDEMQLPPFILIPNQSTYLSLSDVFKVFEFNPEWSDLRIDYGNNWVKLTNTTSSKIVKFSYQSDGILKYIYLQGVGPFEEMTKNGDDEDILLYYKNYTSVEGFQSNLVLTCFDLESIFASINISLNQQTDLFHSGFPYNPTNQSKPNALAYFDLLITNKVALDEINITIYYDHTKFTNIQFYWFNISANQGKGEWEEIPLINLGNGIIIITLNHTSIFVLTGDKVSTLPSEDGNGKDKEEKKPVTIPLGHYYIIFLILAVIGLIIYKKHKIELIK